MTSATTDLPGAGTRRTWRNIYREQRRRAHDGHLVVLTEALNVLDEADPEDLGAEVVCQVDGATFTAFAEELGYPVTGPRQVIDATTS